MKIVKTMMLILAVMAAAWPMMVVAPISGDSAPAWGAASFDGSSCRDKTGTTGAPTNNIGSQMLFSEALASPGSFGAEREGFSDGWPAAHFQLRQLP